MQAVRRLPISRSFLRMPSQPCRCNPATPPRLNSLPIFERLSFYGSAASVDGELVDVIRNIGLVRTFSAVPLECQRLDAHLHTEGAARTQSVLYLEKLRMLHSATTALFSTGLLGGTLRLWSPGRAT